MGLQTVQTLVHYVFDFFPNGINNKGTKEERITDKLEFM